MFYYSIKEDQIVEVDRVGKDAIVYYGQGIFKETDNANFNVLVKMGSFVRLGK